MKKILVALLALLMLAGCSSEVTSVSDPDTVIISGDGVNYTKQDLFIDMKNGDITSILIADLTERIAGFEEIDMTEVEREVSSYFEELRTTYGDQYESMMDYYGGEESFRETMVSSYTLDALVEKYCDYHYDELVTEYVPVLVKMQSFDDEEAATKMIADINGGMTFEEACTEAGIDAVAGETVYTTASDIDEQLKNWFKDCEVGLTQTPVVVMTDSTDSEGVVTTTNTYYVIDVIANDANDFKEEFYRTIASDITTETVFNYYFEKYTIEVYDQDIYELLSKKYEGIN